MESSAVSIHEELNKILDFQTHHKLREAQGRVFAEDLNERTLVVSIGIIIIILIVGVGQILLLRSFFTDNKTASRI